MKINCTSTFIDGTTRYETGDVRTVSDADGARFCAFGWATDITGAAPSGEPAPGSADLAINNSVLGVSDTH
jgi:hypothetical protein